MKLDLSAIDRRKEIAADKDEHHGAEREHETAKIGTMIRRVSSR